DDAETAALLALMLLHHSRAHVRQGLDGRPAPLAEQDRARWDHEMIREGVAQLDAAIVRGSPGAYQLQAAIAALHARAASFEETDWAQIATLYGALARRAPSPVVEVNRAVAVGMADGPRAGLAALEPVLASGPLDGYAPLHAATLTCSTARVTGRRPPWPGHAPTYDALVCPVMPSPAFPHDQEGDPFTRTVVIDGCPRPYMSLLSWTGLISVLGLPSTVAPAGRTSAGLPVGAQVVSAFLRDRESIRLAGILAQVAGRGYDQPPGF